MQKQGGECDAFVGQRLQVVCPAFRFGGEAEVAGNDRECCWAIAPVGVVDGGEGVWMVGTIHSDIWNPVQQPRAIQSTMAQTRESLEVRAVSLEM